MFSIPSLKERDTNTENFGRVKIPLCMTQLVSGNKYFFAFESRCIRDTYRDAANKTADELDSSEKSVSFWVLWVVNVPRNPL